MKKLKGQGKFIKTLASKVAQYNKSNFIKYIFTGKNLNYLYKTLSNKPSITLQVVSFSSNRDFSEQILSILSFIKHVGVPHSWSIYSDGTHTNEQIDIIESVFPFLNLIKLNYEDDFTYENMATCLLPFKGEFAHYAKTAPLGRKLFSFLSHKIDMPTLFLDSDILFYKKASRIIELLKEDFNGWFLPDDNWGCLDSRYIAKHTQQHYQVNSGLMLFNKELNNLSKGMQFFQEINNNYEYFSEQTIMHILLRNNEFMPFDPRVFVLDSADQFDLSYLYNTEDIAARHYTGPVRHKMWQKDWKWHLSLR